MINAPAFSEWWEINWDRVKFDLCLSEDQYLTAKIVFRQCFISGMALQQDNQKITEKQ